MLLGVSALIRFPRLESRTQDEVQKMHDKGRAHLDGPMVFDYDYESKDCSRSKAGRFNQLTIQDGLRRMNYLRWLIGLDGHEIVYYPDLEADTMECTRALFLCNKLTHTPAQAGCTKCVTPGAMRGCEKSNIYQGVQSLGLGVSPALAVDKSVEDAGSGNEPVGHRRWIFHPALRSVSFGKADKYVAINVVGTPRERNPKNDEIPFVAFPAPGPCPLFSMYSRWSFSIPNNKLQKPVSVSVTADGKTLNPRGQFYPSQHGEATFVFTFNTEDLKVAKGSRKIDVKIAANGNEYAYTLKPFDADANYGCLCNLCSGTDACDRSCPTGTQLPPKQTMAESGVAAKQRKWLHDFIVKNEGKEIFIFSLSHPSENTASARVEVHDLQRGNITMIGSLSSGTFGDFVSMASQTKGREDPKYLKRDTTLKLRNIVFRNNVYYDEQKYWGIPSVINLELDWFSAANLFGDNHDVNVLGNMKIDTHNYLKKVSYKGNGKVVFEHVNGSTFFYWSKQKSSKALTLSEFKSLQIVTSNNNIEIHAEKEFKNELNLHVIFENDEGNKKITQTGNWASMSPNAVKAEVHIGKLEVESSQCVSPKPIETVEKNPNAFPEKKSTQNISVAIGVVMSLVIAIAAVIGGVIFYRIKTRPQTEANVEP